MRMGETHMGFVKEGEALFKKRLSHYISKISTIDIPVIKGKRITPQQLKKLEGEQILNRLKPGDFLIILDEKGKSIDSKTFADVLQSWMNRGPKRLVFVVGGAFGFSDDVYQKCDAKLSLSPMTFSHQLIRLIFLEQIYRAFTILRGEPYHNE